MIIREWGIGQQGWYDPNTGIYLPNDHLVIWQVNVNLPKEDWFWQEGTTTDPITYWLDIQVEVAVDSRFPQFGWKTTPFEWHWQDDAVWADWEGGVVPDWKDLHDPLTGQTLDMAFVITTIPEPGVFAIAGLGLLALLRRRRK